jgi:hypothetical protein
MAGSLVSLTVVFRITSFVTGLGNFAPLVAACAARDKRDKRRLHEISGAS